MGPDVLDLTFAALADPTRRAMLARLASGEATVNELAEPFALSQPAISKHLKVLERAGLISRSRAAQTRPCRLEAARLQQVAQWVAPYRALWEDSFDRLDAFLQTTQASTATSTPTPKGKRHVRKP
jgi:DNA-binding transcriptional ArsR family regulator